ncbi:TPA: hypothetical protein ACODIZ_003664 [Salmonella enterica subsp. enterica serovar Newport]
MALRKAIVVGANPQDHSLDLVMVDNYSRYTGVQVQAHTASSRTGSIDLPDVPPRENKWDISQPGAQEIQALVDFVGRVPVITGFIYPQISQMTHADGKLKYNRHTSDVQTYTDGNGNMGILHPSGAHIVLGEAPDPKDFAKANADKSSAIDRNTDKKVYLRVALAGNVAVLTMDPKGNCSLELKADLTVTCENASVTAKSKITLKAPDTEIDGKLHVTGEMTTDSSITSKGDQVANGISTHDHVHTDPQGGKVSTPE